MEEEQTASTREYPIFSHCGARRAIAAARSYLIKIKSEQPGVLSHQRCSKSRFTSAAGNKNMKKNIQYLDDTNEQ
jgi:hypothetical protein